jgi:hypothetical protein
MLRQFLMGGSISVCNIVIHALVMTAVVRASQATAVKVATRPNLLLIAVMVATVSVHPSGGKPNASSASTATRSSASPEPCLSGGP